MNYRYGTNPIAMFLPALIAIVYLVRNVSTATDSATECPVRIRRSHSTSSDSSAVPGSCECSALMEIRCSGGLQAFPEFVPTKDVVEIRGLYAARDRRSPRSRIGYSSTPRFRSSWPTSTRSGVASVPKRLPVSSRPSRRSSWADAASPRSRKVY